MVPSYRYRRAIKKVSKADDLDWINNQQCSSFYNKQISFLNDKENHFYHFFLNLYTSRHKMQVPKGLAEEVFPIRHFI